jgi:hypothetical protein
MPKITTLDLQALRPAGLAILSSLCFAKAHNTTTTTPPESSLIGQGFACTAAREECL